MSMTTACNQRARLLELLKERSFLEKDVTLSSGEKSDWYINGKMVEVCPEGAFLIGEVLYEYLKETGIEFNAVGGLETGAIPIITSLVIACHHREGMVEGFWVRNRAKSHGTQQQIEGKLPNRSRVVIIDDVVTTGKSILKAIDAAEAQECEIVLVVSIVDRQGGAKELFAERGYRYESLFTRKDFLPNA